MQTHPLRPHYFAFASFYVRVTSHLKNSAEAEFFCVVWAESVRGLPCSLGSPVQGDAVRQYAGGLSLLT